MDICNFSYLMAGVQVVILHVMNAKGGKMKPCEIKNINKELNKRLNKIKGIKFIN